MIYNLVRAKHQLLFTLHFSLFPARQGLCPFCSAMLRKRWTNGFKPRGKCICKKQKADKLKVHLLFWCERRDLNPYGITTRPSNVRVCRFRHSRIFSSPFLTTNDIISKSRESVNTFLENILFFSEKNYIVDFRHVDIKAFCRAFRYINRKCNVRFNRNIGHLCAFKYFVGILCGGVA